MKERRPPEPLRHNSSARRPIGARAEGSHTSREETLSGYEHLAVETEGRVARISLSRPESHNALNGALIRDLTQAFDGLAESEGVRVVVLAGEGPSCCARSAPPTPAPCS